MFAFELQRRSEESGWGIASIAAHPAWRCNENGVGDDRFPRSEAG